jgi:hypothetical protein
MNQLRDVIARVRSLVGDPDGDFATSDYLIPLINQALDESVNYLEGTCSPFITKMQDVPNIAAGTTTFIDLQAPGEVLAGLVNPFKIWFKQAGQPINTYCEAQQMDILPFIAPNANPTTRGTFWEWRSYAIYLTPLTYIADFCVRGEFRPAPLLKDDDYITVHPQMTPALAYATAALIGMERGNSGFVNTYGPRAENTLDDISAQLGRSTQGTTARAGRMNRGRRGFLTQAN